MARISQWGVAVDVDVDVDVDDFYDECSTGEKKQLVKYLAEDGFVPGYSPEVGQENLQDITYKKALDKLHFKRIYLTLEEEQFILNLSNKY
jgi:hypothetical protein